eukprot:g4599.t1
MSYVDNIENAAARRGLTLSRADIAFVMGVARSNEPRTEETVSTKRNVDDEKKRTADDLLPRPSSYYLTTAINYANGAPHMGHAYETITSDVVARFHRAFGDDTFFLTGSDEHGQKVASKAAKLGITPKENCDKWVKGFKDMNQGLLMSNDDYIRTTDKKHYEHVAKMWRTSLKNGDIYLDKYEGWYSTRDEKFWTDTEAEQNNYMDGDSKTIKLVKMSEACYMFRMSKYHDRLLKHIEDNPNFVRPAKARKSLLTRLRKDKLRDLSVSRKKLKWGIPIPDDPEHVAYVWFDALNNYLSGIDYLVKDSKRAQYWPCNVHIIGKDIVWFHAVIWPCILFSCGVDLPKSIFAHGFVLAADGTKMSKSKPETFVDPIEALKKHDPDMIRYYLSREPIYGDDFPFDEKMLIQIGNADLANKLGNLVNRACGLCGRYCDSKVPKEGRVVFDFETLVKRSWKALNDFDLQTCAEVAIDAVRAVNDNVTARKPWDKKNTLEERVQCVGDMIQSIYVAAHFLEPVIPNAAKKIFKAFGSTMKSIRELSESNNLEVGAPVMKAMILFDMRNHNKHNRKCRGETKNKGKQAKKISAKALAKLSAWEKLAFRVGRITKVWPMENSDKLYCEEIDLGEKIGRRQIASGLRKHYTLEQMQNRLVVVVENLKPKKLAGFLSQGMVLCGWNEDRSKCEFVEPPKGSKLGERVFVPNVKFTIDPPTLGANASKKCFEKVKKKLKSDASCVAQFNGQPMSTASGVCKCASVSGGQLE